MWGLLIDGEGIGSDMRTIAQCLPTPTIELGMEAFAAIPFRPLDANALGTAERRHLFGFSCFYGELTGRQLMGPADDAALETAKTVAYDLMEPLAGVVVWGNARWLPRLFTRCARQLRKPVLYVEQGWFRSSDGERTWLIDPLGMYTQGECLIDREWEEHSLDRNRAQDFCHRFRAARQTKHQMTPVRRLKIAVKRLMKGAYQPSLSVQHIRRVLDRDGARSVLVAGQVAEDSAQYWGDHLCSNVEELCRGALAHLPDDWRMVVKPHPFDFVFAGRAAELFAGDKRCLWAPDANIHDLIDITDATLTINSNVGLEACVYAKPVILAGEAVYGGRGFTAKLASFDELSGKLGGQAQPDRDAFLRFIDYVTSVYLIDPAASCAEELQRRMTLAHERAQCS